MKNKGFTLIELLAVIVILAVIALITVPIVLNIINDGKEKSVLRSAELYEKPEVETGTYTVQEDGSICSSSGCQSRQIPVEVDGQKPDEGSIIEIGPNKTIRTSTLYFKNKVVVKNENGKRTISDKESSQKESEPIVQTKKFGYMWYTKSSVTGPSVDGDGSNLEQDLPSDENYYLKFKLNDSNKVTNAYACVKFNEVEYCVEGGKDKDGNSYYGYSGPKEPYDDEELTENEISQSTGNIEILKNIRNSNTSYNCFFTSGYSYCNDTTPELYAYSNGTAKSQSSSGYCTVNFSSSICRAW